MGHCLPTLSVKVIGTLKGDKGESGAEMTICQVVYACDIDGFGAGRGFIHRLVYSGDGPRVCMHPQ